MEAMEYEWDEKKRRSNLNKHGIGFEDAENLDWDTALIALDGRHHYGEARYVAFGFIGSRLHTCVYTYRGQARRIISLRKANSREENYYESQTIDCEIETSHD